MTVASIDSAYPEFLVVNLVMKLDNMSPLDGEILEMTANDALTEEINHADQY